VVAAVVEVEGIARNMRFERGAVPGQGGEFHGHGRYNTAIPITRRMASAVPPQNVGAIMAIIERIQAEISGHPIVLFMKGTPQFPMCGFSSRTVGALREAGAD